MNLKQTHPQKGAATLVVSVVLLLVVTLAIIFAARVGLLEVKISANEARHKEAQQLADAAIEQGAAFIKNNPTLYTGNDTGWSECSVSSNVQNAFPCTITINSESVAYEKVFGEINGETVSPVAGLADITTTDTSNTYILFDNSSPGQTLTVVGLGRSKDQTAAAVAKIDYAKVSLITPGEVPPMMAPNLNLNGNFTIVANPNNGQGTTGVPISGWTKSETSSGTGSWQTCHLGDFQDGGKVCSDAYTSGDDWSGCSCTDNLSNKDSINYDIYEDADFPDSPLAYIFGTTDIDEIRDLISASGKYYEGSCDGLDTLDLASLPNPWVFVEGDCKVPSVGSVSLPVLLVVNGTMTLNAGTDAWGLLVSVTEVKSNGSAMVHGSLVAENKADISNGGYSQVYNEDLLNKLASDELNTSLSKIPYSWSDLISNVPN